ncbi:oligosaccharide flippase family protein [Psychroflexus aestuariivivens]|uniref:oligosaccharide flippase family protein n=1 Tax=Psychroflexus aestuariivivens TaxID=1795040 RepID=UPI000FD77EC6|nr:oligosaccharide flippase family protein [Psychroflexus aestuariivivens]
MSVYKKLFQQTFIYGLATVLPRMMSFLLVPIHTEYLPDESIYGEISVIFAYFVLFNVVLSYGMETAFFRFFNKQEAKNQVMSTSAWSLVLSTLIFLGLGIGFQNQISGFVQIPSEYINLIIWILALDAFVIIPFAYLRALGQPKKYAIIKIINVFINVLLNIFFLVWLVNWYSEISVFEKIYIPDFEINYVFIANLVASATTLVLLLPFYFKLKFSFNIQLWKKMMRYGIPVLIAGVAFSINEVFDRILLKYLLPAETAEAQIGIYSACYKLAVFMTLFATAFRLGIEPFFFSHAKTQNPQKAYALITKYFVITGSLIFLGVIAFIEPLKLLIIRDEAYYDALEIVPIILLANLCLGIYHNLSVWYKITDRTRFGAYISVIGAIITLAVNFILIPVIGYLGSAIATLMAYFTMMTLSYIYGKKYYPIPFQTGKIMMYLLLSTALGAISFYYFTENYIFGIASILVLASLIYANEHKEIKSMLKS